MRVLAAFALAAVAALAGCPSSTPGPVRLLAGPAGAVDAAVKAQLSTSRAARRQVVVVVGAPWCEPCVRFHDAVKRGELDAALAGVDLVEFDADADRERLAAAGYSSPMIPLLVVPDDEGRGTARRIFGSIKGPGAVQEMLPRLQSLLR